MLEVEAGDETAYWPPGPPPAERSHQDMAIGAPWYRWDQVVVRGASLERVNEIAGVAGGYVIDIVDLEDMDLGIVGVVELPPETTVPHALLAAAELIDNVEGALAENPNLVEDFSGHGTLVTGALAGTDDPNSPLPLPASSVAGVAPEAELVPVRTICVNCVIHAAMPHHVLLAVSFVRRQADERSRIVNMSFAMEIHPTDIDRLEGIATHHGHAVFSLSRIVLAVLRLSAWTLEEMMRRANLLAVMAAGNNDFIGRGAIRPNTNDEVTGFSWPAAWFQHKDTALVVAATDERGIVSRGSTKNPRRSDGLPVNDVAAAGRCVLTASIPANLYRPASGTSLAAPHVSGVAALVRSLARASGELDLQPAEVYRLITRSAVPRTGSDLAEGFGVLHAYNAIRPFLPELNIEEPKGTEERGQIADLELSEYGERALVLRHGTTDPDAEIFERARLVSYSLGTAGAPRQHQEPLAADPLFVVRGPTGSHLLLTVLQDRLESRSTTDLTVHTTLLSEPMNAHARPVRAESPSFVEVFVGVGPRSIAALRSSPTRIESVHERPDPSCTISGLAYAGGSLNQDPDSPTGWRREERLYVIEDCDGVDGSLLSLTTIVEPPTDDGEQWFDLPPSVELGERIWPGSFASTVDGDRLVIRGSSTLRVFDSSLAELDSVDFSNRALWGVASHSVTNAVYLAHNTRYGGHDDREILTALHFGDSDLHVVEAAGAYIQQHGLDLRLPGRYYYMSTNDPPDEHLALTRRTRCTLVNSGTEQQHQICGLRLLRGAIW